VTDTDDTLAQLRVLASRVRTQHRLSQADVERAGELFDRLDGALTTGGFLPVAWRYARMPLFASITAHGGYGYGRSAAEVGAE